MPLLIYGARQVGKTYTALTFGKQHYKNTVYFNPLDFEEFLWATANREMCKIIKKCYENFSPNSLHDTALDLYKTYLVVGGMPRAVAEYVEIKDFDFVMAAQKSLNDAYIADMAKYATPQETTKIMAAWASVPAQLAKENHKFHPIIGVPPVKQNLILSFRIIRAALSHWNASQQIMCEQRA